MAGEYGLNTLYRAAKADILSLLFFEIGLFGWMAIFQVAIFGWRLQMDTVTYWWMMQVCYLDEVMRVCFKGSLLMLGRSACFLAIGLRFLSIGGCLSKE